MPNLEADFSRPPPPQRPTLPAGLLDRLKARRAMSGNVTQTQSPIQRPDPVPSPKQPMSLQRTPPLSPPLSPPLQPVLSPPFGNQPSRSAHVRLSKSSQSGWLPQGGIYTESPTPFDGDSAAPPNADASDRKARGPSDRTAPARRLMQVSPLSAENLFPGQTEIRSSQGPLLLPPQDRPITPGLLAFDNLWTPAYAYLTPAALEIIEAEGMSDRVLFICAVADLIRVERFADQDRPGFEPFCLHLANGEEILLAARQPLEGALWALKLE